MDKSQIKIIVKKIKPEVVAQACPVCRTFGTVGYAKRVCHGCSGKGYILLKAQGVKNG